LPRKLPHAEHVALGVGIDECFSIGWTEHDIVEIGLPHWNASGKGAALFARIASETSRQPSAKPSSTTEKFNKHRVDHEKMFNPATGLFWDDPRNREIMQGEVVHELPSTG
jgi:hypothetical protein